MLYRKQPDLVETKRKELSDIENISLSFIGTVTNMIDGLSVTNERINLTIDEVKERKEALEAVEKGLETRKQKNSKIIEKFKKLIDEEEE